ncbi:MAG: GNAT family N-acetyltransferase [Chloroflexota bacterium]|nr:GNAT family N-acetyltransferase [Chloroflexota bacterium]
MVRFSRREPPSSALSILPYHRRHRQAIRDLLFRHENTHVHLDWQETDTWLDGEEGVTRLAFMGAHLIGVLAFSEPLGGTCWIRIASFHDTHDPVPLLAALWLDAAAALRATGVTLVALLLLRDWIGTLVAPLGFAPREDIITLRRAAAHAGTGYSEGDAPPVLPDMTPDGITLRSVVPEDIDAIIAIDHRAFAPPWQMTPREIRQAQRISAYSTVAERDRRVVGYQICTVYFDGAHLARLAVDPAVQRLGVGAALVSGGIRHFARRGIGIMTVNTQASNTRSQRLYERVGFRRNGYDLPVWTVGL